MSKLSKKISKKEANLIYQMLDKNVPQKIAKDDMTKAGSIVTLQTPFGVEMAMVLKYVTKSDLKAYCQKHNLVRDEESEIWQCNYAVVGHYKKEEFQEILNNMKFDEKPTLNLLFVKVNSKTSYNIVVGNDPEMRLLFQVIKDIAQADNSIGGLLDQLVKVCTLTLMTDDLRDKYKKALQNKSSEEEVEVGISEEDLAKMETDLDEEISKLEKERQEAEKGKED